MPEPYDYTLKIPNPADAFRQGMQDRMMRDAMAQKQQQMEAAQMQQMQMQKDASMLMQSNDPRDFVNFAIKYPEQGANTRASFEILDKSKKENLTKSAMQIASALFSGNTDVAIQEMTFQAEAYRNAGDERNATAMEALANVAKTNPAVAKTMIGTQLAAVDPDALKSVAMAQKLPSDVAKAEAEARKTQIEADYLGQEKEADIAKTTAEAAEKTNAVKYGSPKQQQEMVDAQASFIEANVTLDEIKSLANEIKGSKNIGSLTGAWGQLPAVRGSSVDLENKLEQLKNVLALPNLDKLKGAMSDKDLMFLKNIATSINKGMSEENIIKELNKIIVQNEDARKRLNEKAKLRGLDLKANETGSVKDTSATKPSGKKLFNKFLGGG